MPTKLNKLYFMSAIEEYTEVIGKTEIPRFIGAYEVVIARDDDWAKKTAFKQNSDYEKDKWKIDACYSLDDLKELLSEKDHAIIRLGATFG